MAQIGLTGQARSQSDRQIAYGSSPFVRPTLRFHEPGRRRPYRLALVVKSIDSQRSGTTLRRWKTGRPVTVPVGELHPIGLLRRPGVAV
jgi:hypothetical protein